MSATAPLASSADDTAGGSLEQGGGEAAAPLTPQLVIPEDDHWYVDCLQSCVYGMLIGGLLWLVADWRTAPGALVEILGGTYLALILPKDSLLATQVLRLVPPDFALPPWCSIQGGWPPFCVAGLLCLVSLISSLHHMVFSSTGNAFTLSILLPFLALFNTMLSLLAAGCSVGLSRVIWRVQKYGYDQVEAARRRVQCAEQAQDAAYERAQRAALENLSGDDRMRALGLPTRGEQQERLGPGRHLGPVPITASAQQDVRPLAAVGAASQPLTLGPTPVAPQAQAASQVPGAAYTQVPGAAYTAPQPTALGVAAVAAPAATAVAAAPAAPPAAAAATSVAPQPVANGIVSSSPREVPAAAAAQSVPAVVASSPAPAAEAVGSQAAQEEEPAQPAEASEATGQAAAQVDLSFKLPSGGRLRQKFSDTDTVATVCAFVDGASDEMTGLEFQLVTLHPRCVWEDGNKMLRDLGVVKQCVVHVEKKK